MKDKKSILGYSKNSPYRDEPAINIQSNQITMKNTDKNILGIGIKNGKPVKVISMKAGESKNYDFGDVDSVLEMPQYQVGGAFQQVPPNMMPFYTGQEQLGQYGVGNPIQPSTPLSEYEQDAASQLDQYDIQQQQEFTSMQGGNTQTGRQLVDNIQNRPQDQSWEQALKKVSDKEYSEMKDREYNSQNPQYNAPFNPYGSVGLNTAASLFGRSLKGGDAGMGILSGAKLGLGLARNIMGGYATENRNQYVDQWSQDMDQRAQNGIYTPKENGGRYFQDGGALSRQDIENIKQSTNVEFSDATAQNLFERIPNTPMGQEQQPLNLGRYKDVGYFDVNQDTLTNTGKNPHNMSTVKPVLEEIRKLNPNRNISFEYNPRVLEDGGSIARQLTGEYVEGQANENPDKAVAEVEKGEYLHSPDGQISEVEGNTHEKGGEKMTAEQLQEGTRIVSDNLKVGGDNAKYFRDTYDIKIKAKDTYADTVDKVSRKLGLKKLVEEEEEIIEKIEKNQKTEQSNTEKLNLQFLSKKLKEIQDKKAPLEEVRKQMVDDIYVKQEESKPREESDQEAVMEDGGMINNEMINSLASKHGIDYDTAYNLYNEFKKGGQYKEMPQYQDGGAQSVSVNVGSNPYQFTNPDSQPMTSEDRFTAGTVTPENYNDRMMALLQEFPNLMQENFEIVQTENGIQDVKPRFGQDSVKALQEGINQIYQDRLAKTEQVKDPAKRKSIQDAIKAEMFTGEGYKNFDALIGDFTSSRRDIDFGINEALKAQGDTPVEDKKLPPPPPEGKKKGTPGQIAFQERQATLPPNAQTAHLMNNYRLGRADATLISPEQALSNVGSQSTTAMNQLNQRPDSQRTAGIAQTLAGTQQAANQAIGQTDLANQQSRAQATLYNTQAGDSERLQNSRERERFERLQTMARENTDQDYRDYFDLEERIRLQQYSQNQQLNLLNQMFENYQTDSSGNIQLRKAQNQFSPRTSTAKTPTTKKSK